MLRAALRQSACHSIIIIIMLIFLISCKLGPNYQIPASAVFNNPAANTFVSTRQSVFSNQPVPMKWWQLYNDPTLNQLILETLAANTDLRAASANLARANAQWQEARSALYPTTNITASYINLHLSSEIFVFQNAPNLPFVNYLFTGGGVVLPLDFFGKIRRGIEAANDNQEAAQAARDLTLITVVAETTSAYTDMCAAGYQLKIAQHLLALQSQTTGLTKRIERAGRATALDISRSNSELEQIRSSIPVLAATSRNARTRLAMLTGHVPAEFNDKIKNCTTLPKLKAKIIPVGDGAALLRRRPDIREAERKLAAATANIGVATANLYPDINLGAFAGTFGYPRDFGEVKSMIWSGGPLISWNFPNRSIAYARKAEAEDSAQAAFAQFDGAVLTALKEVESNLTTYAYDLDRCQNLKAAYVQSNLAFLQAKTLYRNGREGFLTVLEAEKTLTNVSALLAVAQSKLVTDQINLFLSLGGGWS